MGKNPIERKSGVSQTHVHYVSNILRLQFPAKKVVFKFLRRCTNVG